MLSQEIYVDFNRSKNKKTLQRGSVSNKLSGEKPTSKLTLLKVKPEDTGTYMCVSKAADSQATWTTFHHISVCSKCITDNMDHILSHFCLQ